MPTGITSVRVVAVGGGAGGSFDHEPGGPGGYVNCSTITVAPGSQIQIVVGAGGAGGAFGSTYVGVAGGASSFGEYVTAAGGTDKTWPLPNYNGI